MRLLVLHHETCDLARPERHFVHFLAARWRARGVEVIHRAGCRDLPAADLALLHVDLSVVPARFADALRDYPRVWNLDCLDIRKSALPHRDLVLGRDSDYAGPVIVKSDCNCGALPERRARRALSWNAGLMERWRLLRAGATAATDYPVYPSLRAVPSSVRRNPALVVEKFLPERDGEHHVTRWAYFCGSREFGCLTRGRGPVVRWVSGGFGGVVPVPPEIRDYRRRIGLDYGKIDFVIHEGRPLVLDVNKTIGGPDFEGVDAHISDGLAEGVF